MENENTTDINLWDYVRVVNVRGEAEHQATEDEKVIVAHRANPILGNKHPMKTNSMKERDRVIAEYKKDLNKDLAEKGEMYESLKEIAKDIVENKQKIAFSCFCMPANCHALSLVPVVVKMAEELLEQKNENTKKIKMK